MKHEVMTPEAKAREKLSHPCKETCSGWKQGYEEGVQAERDKVDRLKAALEFYAEGDLVGDLEIRPEKKELWSIPEQWERRSMSDHWSGKRARAALKEVGEL